MVGAAVIGRLLKDLKIDYIPLGRLRSDGRHRVTARTVIGRRGGVPHSMP